MTGWVKKPTAPEQEKGRLLVVVGTYSIGKERIVLGIAKMLGSKIYAPAGKRRICACLEDPELMEMLTDDPKEGQVHMTSLGEIRAEVQCNMNFLTKRHYSNISTHISQLFLVL